MIRVQPDYALTNYACSIVAVSSALGYIPKNLPKLRSDGWATLNVTNKFVRENLPVKKRVDYRRGERPLLKDLHLDGQAIVCVYGHLIYLDHETYYSFFDNEEDEVVAVWILENRDNRLKLL